MAMVGKLGKLAARRPSEIEDFATYMVNPLPTAPASYPFVPFKYAMLGNGPDLSVTTQGSNFEGVGDCTLAGVTHLRRANELENKELKNDLPTANQVVAEYFVQTGGQDTGLEIASVLQTWNTTGLFNNKISGYAPLNLTDLNELRYVIANFGGAYLGVNLPEPAEQQTSNDQPWDITGTREDNNDLGGHCICACGYDETYLYVVTWGTIQSATWAWVARYLEESWAVLTTEDARVNLTALQADLAKVK